ncbi:MAG: hypothetical protein QM729_06580 [Solirubrobacterales bacterium]
MRAARHDRMSRTAGRTGQIVLAFGLLAAIAAGCGGGSESSETTLRKKLEAAAQKIKTATSARMSLGFEAQVEGEEQHLGCLYLATETEKPERFELTFFNFSCEGGTEAHQLIAVGDKAWASAPPEEESWTPATITARLRKELAAEQTDVDQLFVAAENIEEIAEGRAIEGKAGKFVNVPAYTFEAPASAFPGAGDDLGEVDVDFEAVLDRKGYLRELVIHGEEEETTVTVTATYEDIDRPLGISPPDSGEVHGSVQRIDSKAALDELFGLPSS